MNGFGIPWVAQIAPNKESVYPEHLPTEIVPSRRRPVHELLRVAKRTRAPVTYPVNALMGAKSKGTLYFQTDTHWNQRGAYVAYRALCTELVRRGLELPVVSEDRVSWITRPHIGDLGSKLQPPMEGLGVFAKLDQHSARLVFDNGIENHGRVMIFEQPHSSGPTCMAFGESFTNQVLLFLKESFRRLVFVHTSMLIPEALRWERPDALVNLPLERFLIRVPSDDLASFHLAETVQGKVAGGFFREFPVPYLLECPQPERAELARQVGALPWL